MKNKPVRAGSRTVFSFLVISVLCMVYPLDAGSKAGAQLKIVTKDGTKIREELPAIKATILIIRSADNVAGYSFVDEVRRLKRKKR